MFDSQRFLSGDREYARNVIREHSGFVLMVCRSYARDDDQAEDLVQETWKTVVARAGTFKGSGSFRAWLHRVATNACLSSLRSHKSSSEGLKRYAAQVVGTPESLAADPLRATARRELHFAIHRALALLTDGERAAITLRVLEGRSPQEVASMMEVTPATVRSHLRHGINHLRRIMEEPDSDLSRHRATH